MELFCRKRSCSDSPPPVEVMVKRCSSCPETCKPLAAKRRTGEPLGLLPGFFRATQASKRISGAKSNSSDDVSLQFLNLQGPESLGQTKEDELTGCKVFSNPLYQPPEIAVTSYCHANPTEAQIPAQASNYTFKPLSPPLQYLVVKNQESEQDVGEDDFFPRSLYVQAASSEPSLIGRLTRKASSKWKRKESKFVRTQPLYQDYWVRCTMGDHGVAGSSFSVDSSLSFAGLISSSLLGASSNHTPPRDYTSSLWQELPEVKSRRLLESIRPPQRQLQEVVFEVVTSEASYQRSLSVAVSHFQKSRKLSDCLGTTDMHTLFSNLRGVREVSDRFLLDLEDGLERDVFLTDVGEVILRHCPAFQRVYIPYVTNQMYQEKLMQQLVRENVKFLQVLQRLEEQQVCRRQPLKSFLVLPFQRITRLKILLENILKLAQGSSDLAHSVSSALTAVGQIVTACNEGVRSMMQTEELVLLEKQVAFMNTKALPLISRGRVLVEHGELMQIFFQEMGAGHRPRLTTKPLYLHLFSDLLLLSHRRDDGRFLVADYADRVQVKADHFKAKALGLPDLAFLLRLRQNHAGTSCEFILQATSESEKERWISLITSPVLHGRSF
ncbi:rho guanine nucleotide exchange factor 19-like isoform X2 [Ascaphus truei]